MRILLFGLIILTSFGACNLFQKYEGFSKTRTGIHYKLHMIGENVAPPQISDFITADIKYITASDSIFFSGHRTFQLTQPDYKGSIDECFMMLSTGDSASFYLDAQKFFTLTLGTQPPKFIKPGEDIRIEIKLLEIRSQAQYQKDKEDFLSWIEDFGEYEKLILTRFMNEQKIAVDPTNSGMYYVQLHAGTGKPVEIGDLVTINFEGRFLNGKFFDSTTKRNQPFEFVYGSEMQVIHGLEEAVGRMREGEKALVILPSGLAWGEKGSSTGIIPPFTSVIYEVELVQAVQRDVENPITETEEP